jgi:hypothetical protein
MRNPLITPPLRHRSETSDGQDRRLRGVDYGIKKECTSE